MHSTVVHESYVCHRCIARGLQSQARLVHRNNARRAFATTPRRADSGGKNEAEQRTPDEEGAMSRRLKDMTEQSLKEGGRSARKAIQEAGFSDELKKQLEARIRDNKASRVDTTAAAVLSMPNSAGPATRDAALAPPWMGSESVTDASMRMLQDAHKPLRSGSGRSRRAPAPRLSSLSVDARMKQALQPSKGARLANARDRTSIYAVSQDPNLSDDEKEEMRKILRERFQPGARPMPTTIQGLTSLANERIEDAIARGQFKNIPRGKGVGKEVDHNANSPFINTTEYFMNKMIQRQDIVPPWIEKQQEVTKTASTFRKRIRNDWKRHAARVIASRGGSLSDQVRRAEAYAAAEAELNPKAQKVEAISQIDDSGKLSQVNIVETPAAPSEGIDATITVVETPAGTDATEIIAKVAATSGPSVSTPETTLTSQSTSASDVASASKFIPPSDAASTTETTLSSTPDAEPTPPPEPLRLPPFRDPQWEEIELAYHSAALKELNSLTRSYNLMAPELAKKPYYSLQRELASCFADVAPQLAGEIQERARRPQKIRVDVMGQTPGSVLERFAGETAKVYDSKKPLYGIKEFWRDLWGSSGEEKRV